jgi:hypothetical protein
MLENIQPTGNTAQLFAYIFGIIVQTHFALRVESVFSVYHIRKRFKCNTQSHKESQWTTLNFGI